MNGVLQKLDRGGGEKVSETGVENLLIFEFQCQETLESRKLKLFWDQAVKLFRNKNMEV
jgi:hypothetical protein